jgi:hypothetical protein
MSFFVYVTQVVALRGGFTRFQDMNTAALTQAFKR